MRKFLGMNPVQHFGYLLLAAQKSKDLCCSQITRSSHQRLSLIPETFCSLVWNNTEKCFKFVPMKKIYFAHALLEAFNIHISP